MSTASQLRSLLARPGLVRVLAPHDAFTARILEQAGIEMLFLGGFGAAASRLGVPDLGLVTPGEMAECIRSITDRVLIPLIADGDTGHGPGRPWPGRCGPSSRQRRRHPARRPARSQRCGHFAGKQVVPVATMLDRLAQAADARRDPEFVIVARTDARAVEGLDAAIERANRYAEAGADVGFVEAPRSTGELARIAREVPLPQLANMLPGGVTPLVPLDELERMGFKVAVDPTSTLAWWGCRAAPGGCLARGGRGGGVGGADAVVRRPRAVAGGRRAAGGRRSAAGVAAAGCCRPRAAAARLVRPVRGPGTHPARRAGGGAGPAALRGAVRRGLARHRDRSAAHLRQPDGPAALGDALGGPYPHAVAADRGTGPSRRAGTAPRANASGRFRGRLCGHPHLPVGSRFRIERAVVWNIVDAAGVHHGQAATFAHWTPVDRRRPPADARFPPHPAAGHLIHSLLRLARAGAVSTGSLAATHAL